MGDEQATVKSTLECAENAGTSGGGLQTDIQAHLESALLTLDILSEVVLTVDLLLTLVNIVEAEKFKGAASEEKTSGVASSPVLQTEATWETVAHKLLGSSLSQNLVSLDGGIRDLGQHVAVGDTDNHAILRSAEKTGESIFGD